MSGADATRPDGLGSGAGGGPCDRIDLEAVFQLFTSLIFLLDRDGTYLDFRAGGAAKPFVAPEAFLGRRVAEVLPEAAADRVMGAVARTLATGRETALEYELPGEKGPDVFEARLVPQPGGRVAVVVEQVTERRAAERSLRDSEERYRQLFEGNPHPMWVYDLETLRILAVNDAAVDHYGYTRQEFLGLTIAQIRPPEDVERLLENVSGVTDGLDRAGTWRHQKKGGEVIEVEITSHTLEFDGRPAELVLAHDVSEQRRLEGQLRQAQKMEAVGRLAGGVAHDFNNVLTAIMGSAELALGTLPPDAPQRRHLKGVLEASERAASVTRQLLAFSRKQVMQPELLDLNGVVFGMERMLRRLLGEDIEIETHTDPDLWPVRADLGQLEQVLLNLAVNSRDAMPAGGRLSLETTNVALDQAYCRSHAGVTPGSYVLLAVSDTGQGMTAEVKGRLFEPFFTTKGPGKGTGLGLSTVYGIVKQSGGHIWVYSEEGRGTTFKVYLPRAEAAGAAPRAADDASPPGGSETVLLAEDDPAVRAVVSETLEAGGYRVLAAAGPEEALELARSHPEPLHLLLTDVVMPGLQGPELARRVEELRPGVRVLYISGYTENAIVHHGVLEEGVSYLQKPFTVSALARKVRAVLDGRD